MSFDAIFDRNFFDVGLNYVGGSCRSEDLKGKKNHFRWLFKAREKKKWDWKNEWLDKGIFRHIDRTPHFQSSMILINWFWKLTHFFSHLFHWTFEFEEERTENDLIIIYKTTLHTCMHTLVVFFFLEEEEQNESFEMSTNGNQRKSNLTFMWCLSSQKKTNYFQWISSRRRSFLHPINPWNLYSHGKSSKHNPLNCSHTDY